MVSITSDYVYDTFDLKGDVKAWVERQVKLKI